MRWLSLRGWSKTHQVISFVMAACLGGLLVFPWCWGSWMQWNEIVAMEEKLLNQRQMTETLQIQTMQLLHDMPDGEKTSLNGLALMALASPGGLYFSRTSQEVSAQMPNFKTLQVQLLHTRFDLTGSWAQWHAWLDRWATQAPGVSVSSLLLKANFQGGLEGHMVAVIPQRMKSEIDTNSLRADEALLMSSKSDPFDAQRWAKDKTLHGQSHPSYAKHVAPELLRAPEPLERYAREHLHYVGQITLGADVQALIRVLDPASSTLGEVHRIRVGAYAGQHFGKLSVIDQDYLVLDELQIASGGEWQRQPVRLPLRVGRQ